MLLGWAAHLAEECLQALPKSGPAAGIDREAAMSKFIKDGLARDQDMRAG